MKNFLIVAAIAAAVAGSAQAASSLSVNFVGSKLAADCNATEQNDYVLPGGTLYYCAVISNTGVGTDPTLFLNTDTTTLASFQLDTVPFLDNFPASLAAGASSGPFVLFSLTVDVNMGQLGFDPLGTYVNGYSLQYGIDANDTSQQANAPFQVHVVSQLPGGPSVPEPATWALSLSAIAALGWRRSIIRS